MQEATIGQLLAFQRGRQALLKTASLQATPKSLSQYSAMAAT